MARIENLTDFKEITSNITSFSHAYLFNVNSLDLALPYVKEFAKNILFGHNYENKEYEDMCRFIDNDEFDDLYIVNPDTIGINTEEINKLLTYMETKSIRDNGKRVYVIYGFERLSRDVSNKILKFLEEPEDDIYGLLITENFEKILPTIVSRCQVLNLVFPIDAKDLELFSLMRRFLVDLIARKKTMIAYEYEYFGDLLKERINVYNAFETLESIISETINNKCNHDYDKDVYCEELLDYPLDTLIKVLNITNQLKCLIKNNINLNLLIDRYIIEITEELELCKK